jgi:hypothetical protein
VFIVKVNINRKSYYLADLRLTLSPNYHDSIVMLDSKTALAIERDSEEGLELAFQVPVICEVVPVDKGFITEEW